jgi:hypothetical protein
VLVLNTQPASLSQRTNKPTNAYNTPTAILATRAQVLLLLLLLLPTRY